MVFPRTMADYGALLDDDAVVLISGRVDTRDDDPKIICQEVRRPELQLEGVAPPLRIRLAANRLVGSLPDRLRDLLRHYPGQSEVFLHLGEKVLRLPDEFRVDVAGGLLGELRALLGADAVVT
jgi:DNA polymerase-3 subunit alpha